MTIAFLCITEYQGQVFFFTFDFSTHVHAHGITIVYNNHVAFAILCLLERRLNTLIITCPRDLRWTSLITSSSAAFTEGFESPPPVLSADLVALTTRGCVS